MIGNCKGFVGSWYANDVSVYTTAFLPCRNEVVFESNEVVFESKENVFLEIKEIAPNVYLASFNNLLNLDLSPFRCIATPTSMVDTIQSGTSGYDCFYFKDQDYSHLYVSYNFTNSDGTLVGASYKLERIGRV